MNPDGTVTIYGVTATNDNITDVLADTLPSQVTSEDYSVFLPAQLGTVFRGVATEVPEPASMLLFGSAVLGLPGVRRRCRS